MRAKAVSRLRARDRFHCHSGNLPVSQWDQAAFIDFGIEGSPPIPILRWTLFQNATEGISLADLQATLERPDPAYNVT